MSLRLVFMGTPAFALPALAELVGQGHEIAAVYCQPPRPAGRGMAEQMAPVHRQADVFGLPVLTPASLKSAEEQSRFSAHAADAAVVVAYGLILPQPVLDAPRLGCYNIHASLLPRWRGAAPIQRAIMAGDRETGVAVMKMDAGLDTGPVCLAEPTVIGPEENAGDLHDRLSVLGADLIGRALGALERGGLACAAQDQSGATYAAKIDKAETAIDWSRTATDLHNHIRGLSPVPGAWCLMPVSGRQRRVRILRARVADVAGRPGQVLDDRLTIACGAGALVPETLQPAGKSVMDRDAFLRGNPVPAGSRL